MNQMIEYAAEHQDTGKSVVLVGPSDASFDPLFDEMIDTLDMSRVICYSQGQVQVATALHPDWSFIFFGTKSWDQSLLILGRTLVPNSSTVSIFE